MKTYLSLILGILCPVANVVPASPQARKPAESWQLRGNAGTTPGLHFVGTTDNQPLELWVNGQPALRLEPNAADAPNLIGGARHFVAAELIAVTIGGGFENSCAASYGTIAGGTGNVIGSAADVGTIGGGYLNAVGGVHATISGGSINQVLGHGEGSVIGGGAVNTTGFQSRYATIAGGHVNLVQSGALFATIAGGEYNTCVTNYTTVGGGGYNIAGGFASTVAGGGDFLNEADPNVAGGDWSVVSGGRANRAQGHSSVISGGENNLTRGSYAAVPGGLDCEASGQLSFAAGWSAKALHDGAFVWADASPTFGGPPFASTTNNQFNARAAGGVRFYTDTNATTGAELAAGSGTWSSLSDRHAKENFTPASGREILEKVAALPLASWNYKTQDKSIRHLGPMAQDFRAAFGLGESDRTITTVDADGVALAAIQGLNQKLEEKGAEIQALQQSVAELKQLVGRFAEQHHGGAR